MGLVRRLGVVCVVAVSVGVVLGAGEATPDYVGAREALRSRVVEWNQQGETAWENVASAMRAMETVTTHAANGIRLRRGLTPEDEIDLDPLMATDGGQGETGMEIEVRSAVDSVVGTYVGNRVYHKLTSVRLASGAFVPLDDGALIGRDVSFAPQVRRLGRLELARMWGILELGEGRRAGDAMETAMALAVVMLREPSLDSPRIEGMGIVSDAALVVRRWAESGGMDREASSELLGRYERQRRRFTDIGYAISGERLTALDTVARVFDGEFDAAELMVEGEVGEMRDRAACEAAVMAYFEALSRWASAPAHERRGMERPSEIEAVAGAGLVYVPRVKAGLERLVWLLEVSRVDGDALALMLALERYRDSRGWYPEELGAVVPEYLRELPRDGFAPDGAYRYRVVDGGAGCELWSVGYDGADDGGKGGESALWPSGAGTDHVMYRGRAGRAREAGSE